MKVLVTGGAGFIGSHVVEQLLDLGHEVCVYDKLVDQVHEGNGPRYVPEAAEFCLGDMSDRATLEKALRGIEQVVHLAAEVGVGQSMYEIERYVNANTGGTGVLLDILANSTDRISKLVVASSMSIYGEGLYTCNDHGQQTPRLRSESQLRLRQWEPICSVCEGPLDPLPTPESKPLFPTSVYAISKMDQELLCLAVGAAYGIDVTAVRYFNAYGPRQALSNPYTGVAAIFCGRLLNGQQPIVMEDGQQRRDFIHVSDVARATVKALTAPAAAGRAINIGVGDPISITDVALHLATALDLDIEPEITGEYRAGDIRHCWADPTLASELLEFEPKYRFATNGISELLEWVTTQQPVDRGPDANAELRRRGLRV